MSELADAERETLRLVGVGAIRIRALARLLPDSPEAREILALADGMHNIPAILAGSPNERQASAERLRYDVEALNVALGIKAQRARLTKARPILALVDKGGKSSTCL